MLTTQGAGPEAAAAGPGTAFPGGTMASRNRSYEAPLDYLRALAALTVVVYHVTITYRGYTGGGADWLRTSWPRFWNPVLAYVVEGHTAVTLFMVLSGYVLTRGVVGREVGYGRFIGNRMLRILPLYVFVLMFGMSIHPENFSLAGFVQTLLPLANLPGALQSEVLTALFWSVAVEFQFYLLFPFLKRFMEREGVWFGLRVIGLFLLFRLLALAYVVDMQHFVYVTIFGRMDQFVIGMMLAFLPQPRWLSHRAALPAAFAVMLALLLAYHRAGGYPPFGWWKLVWPFVEALGWGLVIAASLGSPWRMPGAARTGLVFVANMSFSLYVMHSTVLQILGSRQLYVRVLDSVYPNALVNAVLFLPPVLALSWVTYAVIERPFMGLRRRYVAD